jgi:hypothetical protein
MNRQLTAKTNTKYRKTEEKRKGPAKTERIEKQFVSPELREILRQINIFRKFFRGCSCFR